MAAENEVQTEEVVPTEPQENEPEPQEPEPEQSEDDTFLSGITEDNAVLLLAAAEEQGLDQSVVVVDNARGGFTAPAEVIAKAKSSEE